MKRIFYFLSLFGLLFVVACQSESTEVNNLSNANANSDDISEQILIVSEHIQSSNEEHLNINDLRPYLIKLSKQNVAISDSSSFIVELKIPFNETTDNQIKEKITNKFNKPLVSNELTTWYLHTNSGKELEISIIEKKPQITLRFLLRTYL